MSGTFRTDLSSSPRLGARSGAPGGLRRRLDRGPVRHGSPRRRLLTTWLVAVLATGALVVRLVALQVSPSDRLIEAGEEQRLKTITIDAPRGAIVDRNGADLAISVPRTTFYADARGVTDAVGDAAKLAAVLQTDPVAIQEKLLSGKAFVYVARQVDDETAAAIDALDLPYLGSYREDERVRPSGEELGISVIGRTDPDRNGITGLEKQYDGVLSGDTGTLVVEQGAGGRTIPGGEEDLDPATAGANVVLSLDRGLQFEVEQLLARTVDEAEAKGGTVLVARPNGEILVDANVVRPELPPAEGASADAEPVYGPARPTTENRAVTWTYEPGSVNKIITMAAVLEEGLATPDTSRLVASNLQIYDKNFAQESRPVEEEMTLRDILARSDNLGTMLWAGDLGEDRLKDYLGRFGFGRYTGLDFPGESRGKMPDKWRPVTLPTVAIGQGIAVTPMQMLDAYNVIANRGVASPAKLVLGTESPDGEFTPTQTAEPQRVVSEATAASMRDMLAAVVRDGTGKRAQVDGFTVGGKTGTAWKPVNGDYVDEDGRHKLVTSFVGFLPADDPQLTILVVIDEPADPYATGGTVAAPLFREVASYAVGHLRIPPDLDPVPVDPETERVRAEPQPLTPTTAPATADAEGSATAASSKRG